MKVRALEWNEEDYCPSAECIFGHYVIHPGYCHVELLIGYGRMMATSLGRIELPLGTALDDLKQAAFVDYEARVTAALQENDDDLAKLNMDLNQTAWEADNAKAERDKAERLTLLLLGALKHCVIERDEWLDEARAGIAQCEAAYR